MRRSFVVLGSFFVVLAFAIIPTAHASFFAPIHGVVHDPSHRPIRGVQVTIHAAHSAVSFCRVTGADGTFHVNNIPAGVYIVTVMATHFAPQKRVLSVTADSQPMGVWQNGRWGDQSDSAGATALEGGFKLSSVPSSPWVRGGWFRSSGDNNPLDNRHTTFFQILTTPRLYARFPIYKRMNNTDTFAQVIDTPTKKLALRSDLHWVSLTSAKDLWYQGGGAFNSTAFGYVGRLPAGTPRWQPSRISAPTGRRHRTWESISITRTRPVMA